MKKMMSEYPWYWWALAAVSIIGTVLNVWKLEVCFVIWMVCNGCWLGLHIRMKHWPRVLVDAVYFGLAIYGIFAWS